MKEKWDVHTHTTLSPATFEPLMRFAHYERFLRVRAHASKPCCAEMVDSKGKLFRVIEDNAYVGASRIKECDSHGVTMQVLSPTPGMIPDFVTEQNDAAEICRILNDDNARMVADFPTRLTAIGALPMNFADAAIAEMERIKKLGMRGVEINSNIDGMDLDHPQLWPIFEAAAALDMAIFIHPWGGFMEPSEDSLAKRMNANRDWLPWLTGMPLETSLAFNALVRGGVHERLPHLRVLYAHGGGAFPALVGRLEHGAYCRPDLFKDRSSLTPYQAVEQCGVYTDSLTHSPFAFQMLFNLMGCERIAMGSDYPYPLGEIDPFDSQTLQDPKGNQCPYPATKGFYPGHMIERLPEHGADMEEAWKHFPWLSGQTPDGSARELLRLNDAQRQRMLSGTAKEWLGYDDRAK
jgi:aminocarboxymuconate-semialdehyde decarboxylase